MKMFMKKIELLFLVFFVSSAGALLASTQETLPNTAPAHQASPPPEAESSSSPISLFETKSQTSSYEHAFLKMILTLIGLLVLVFGTLWILRKLSHGKIGSFSSLKKIKIVEKRPLSPKTVLYLVEIGDKQIFLTESQLEVKTLLLPAQEEEKKEQLY
jgi:flagellar biogenesis protein FliO